MQSFGFNQFGPPSVFKEIVQAPPVLSPIRVLVDVIGFGLNPYDAALRRGEQQAKRPLPFPIVPGTDVVGTINSIGSDVTDYLPGDLVIAHPNIGGYASQVPVSHNKIGRLPSAFPIEQAVGLP
ncbi:alcohol dehydrogenase catalytic domain-containing protein [Loigolactobacillus backii]|uniref:alcohol dehydrogenase catalytic domain-containing protein n=1 Tax=Loigolactobacillus backii TaxID=375175 RepID=UPI001EE6D80F|nr:alcohol dehydrogenase catalytic domain-containing protein [Loigolactobacillus backii]